MFHVNVDEIDWEAGRQLRGVSPSTVPDEARRGVRRKVLTDGEAGPVLSLVEMPPGHYVRPHSHSEPEVMYVLEGSVTVGGVTGTAGSSVGVGARVRYDVQAGDDGVTFLLFRAKPAKYLDGGDETPPS